MRYNTSIDESSHGAGEGAVEFDGREFVIFKKSQAVWLFFGAIGNALAHGKEIMRFSMDDIISCRIIQKTFHDRIRIELRNGEHVVLVLKGDMVDDICPVLKDKIVN